MQNKTISVSQLSGYLKKIIDAEIMLKNISVVGEVSGYKVVRGIAYFSIKDENSLLNCVLFNSSKFDAPKIGDKIIVTGSPSYYVKGGKLSFNATKIQAYGLGDLYKKFLELKKQLDKEGFFDHKYKKALPKMPKRIGVVSSETGAVIQDIINVVSRRNNLVDIVLYPVKVQGQSAEFEVEKAIDFFNSYDSIDVIIVARGGGSLEDLQPFNTERIAKAVFKSKKPIISAIGHETDFTIIDFVSDLRAPTPSAAAELVVADYISIVDKLKALTNRLVLSQAQKINLSESLLKNYASTLNNLITNQITKQQNTLDMHTNSLSKLNPANILIKGYARIESENKLINSAKDLKPGKEFTARMKDGKIKATVKSVEEIN
jgi:exodeoxyribonuclease VII large subunit